MITMLLQATFLVLIAINSGIVPASCATKMTVEEYLRLHAELSPLTDENEQQTVWDRSSLPNRDLTYPVENHPVPEGEAHLMGGRKRPKLRSRERRQISSESCYLFFANRVHVIKMQNSPSFKLELPQTGFSNAAAVDFDKRDDLLFWSDVAEHKIYRSRTNGSEFTVLVDTNITTPDGIAWDWVNKKLYWTDVGDRDLEVYDPTTGCRKVLIQYGPSCKPRAIVLDPTTRWMYWTDWGSPAKIERASMDGSNRMVLFNTSLWWPNALSMDYDSQTLYWMDAALDKLESSRADGSGRTLLSTLHIYHPFSLTFYQGDLFWSDWELNAILATSLSDLSVVNVLFGNLTLDPMGVSAVCGERQEMASNPCDGQCKNFCLLSSSKPQNYSCNCCTPSAVAECEISCGVNGQCTGHNYCTCNDGWRGSTCDQGVCAEACAHGDCTAPNVCSCDDGWEGQDCAQAAAICCSGCGHGTCTSPDQCTCEEGWAGALCDQPVESCSVVGGCQNGGSCKSTYCECPQSYGGINCEKFCGIQMC